MEGLGGWDGKLIFFFFWFLSVMNQNFPLVKNLLAGNKFNM